MGELTAYADEMQPLRAEWLLDLAQAAAYPSTMQFAPDAAQAWWSALSDAASGAATAVATVAQKTTGFVLNNVSVTFDSLSQQLSRLFGGGVSQ